MRYADLADVACLANARAEEFAYGGTAVAIVAAAAAWRTRAKVAAAGQQGLWAIAAALAGVMHVICAMFLVPPRCLSGHLFGELLGAASPWFLAAGLFRSGVAPTPSALGAAENSERRA